MSKEQGLSYQADDDGEDTWMGTVPFNEWPSDPHARWIHAANTFGRHLMAAARDYAFAQIPESAPPEVREAAEKAALDAIYGMMMLFDGVAESRIDQTHRIQYALFARVLQANQADPVEQFELAPDGDGLCMGYHGWVAGAVPFGCIVPKGEEHE